MDLTSPAFRIGRSLTTITLTAVLLLALLTLSGCGNSQDPLDIRGNYTTTYGETDVITQTTWTMTYAGSTSVFHILGYSNGLMFVLAKNDDANAYDAGLYSRFTWTVHGGQLYYCQDPYNAATEDAARNAPAENDNDPASKGCGASAGNDFAWTELTPQ